MDFQFTFKNMESSESLMTLAAEKISARIAALSGYCINPHLTFSSDRGMQKIHFSMLTKDGFRIEVSHCGPDIFAELDEVSERIETQMRRHKEKLREHKRDSGIRRIAKRLPRFYYDTLWDHVLNQEPPIDARDVLKFERARRHAPWSREA